LSPLNRLKDAVTSESGESVIRSGVSRGLGR
jgi:hypothetical protein